MCGGNVTAASASDNLSEKQVSSLRERWNRSENAGAVRWNAEWPAPVNGADMAVVDAQGRVKISTEVERRSRSVWCLGGSNIVALDKNKTSAAVTVVTIRNRLLRRVPTQHTRKLHSYLRLGGKAEHDRIWSFPTRTLSDAKQRRGWIWV